MLHVFHPVHWITLDHIIMGPGSDSISTKSNILWPGPDNIWAAILVIASALDAGIPQLPLMSLSLKWSHINAQNLYCPYRLIWPIGCMWFACVGLSPSVKVTFCRVIKYGAIAVFSFIWFIIVGATKLLGNKVGEAVFRNTCNVFLVWGNLTQAVNKFRVQR